MDLTLYYQGNMCNAYEYFGAHIVENGVVFRTYAPHARSIHVIGEFNNWCENEESKMIKIDKKGVFELFIQNAKKGQSYKLRIKQAIGNVVDKADPYAFASQLRPDHASIIEDIHEYVFDDEKWMKTRTRCFDKPMNIYEIHLGAWLKKKNQWMKYEEIADEIVSYCKKMNYTHVEFMPLSEHPYDGSWGYQTTGYFSATSRYGSINGLKYLINQLHNNGIGAIMDIVPVHFAKDKHGLGYFDGTPLYEYDREVDANSEWGTSNFNLWREEVCSFLMSAANFWLDICHFDGLRMDAIANLIYWQGNKDKGVNEGAIRFIKSMNEHLHRLHPTACLIAEDSSSYEKVTDLISNDGLGFDYKWDLGWMHDTLSYLKLDPMNRQYHHNQITFSMYYAFNEKYILPLSHDEVVHGKCSIIEKMWGTYEEKFAQARTLYLYMMTHPGKKLNFMGNEIAQIREFDENKENDWFLLEYPIHHAFHKFIQELNQLTTTNEAFYKIDNSWDGFKWIDADNKIDNIFIYQRMSGENKYIIVLNFSNQLYKDFRMGIEENSIVKEVLNSDSNRFFGLNIVNKKALFTSKIPYNHLDYSVKFDIAPFSGIVFEVNERKKEKINA